MAEEPSITRDAVDLPDAVFVGSGDDGRLQAAQHRGHRFTYAGVEVETEPTPDGLNITIGAPGRPLSWVGLRWRRPPSARTLVLGDAWERGYGELQWQHLRAERVLPWYWLGHDEETGRTSGMGVRVQPGAMCSWRVDEEGVTLWLDCRNGGGPTRLGERRLRVATVVATRAVSVSPFAVLCSLCEQMCPRRPRMIEPVVGCNNWYYAFGRDVDAGQVVRDAATIVELTSRTELRPFAVVDAGWSSGGPCAGGPWDAGRPGRFDDMAQVAGDIARVGARPGIWFRPLAVCRVDREARLRQGRRPADPDQPLDPTLPENRDQIAADMRRFAAWGFDLVKHDFSTFDLFGRFGPAMGAELTDPGWHFSDCSRTNAEIVLDFYRLLRQSAESVVIIGCNTIGHLAAGLVDLQRVGDDTAGRGWDRTRRMGVNALAFRLAQHGRFFLVDADCVALTPWTPWARQREFLDLVARSGTALFVSLHPEARRPDVDADLRRALAIAASPPQMGGVEPVDWLYTTTPRRWMTQAGQREYGWLEASGVAPGLEG